jgi:hypothetical protein
MAATIHERSFKNKTAKFPNETAASAALRRSASSSPRNVEIIPMAEATAYFRPREQRMRRQFRAESALRVRRRRLPVQ